MHKWKERNQDDLFRPIIKPKFKISPKAKFFALGSCFAREIELALHNKGMTVLSIPPKDMLLDTNRYHLPAILQGIRGSVPNTKESFVEIAPGCWGDPYQQTPQGEFHSLEQLMALRARVDTLTQKVHHADVVVITLGLTESWYDYNTFQNAFRNFRDTTRFSFDNMNQHDCYCEIEELIDELHWAKIILTVSPIPLNATFTDQDVVTANAYSKAALRSAAQEAAERHDDVDYFPSYEIALNSKDPWRWEGDRHINKKVIGHITNLFIEHYIEEVE